MAACRIDADASPQFKELREHWKKHGYPSIERDLADAFSEIQKDIHAKHWRRVARFATILQKFELYKYRQKNTGAREGAKGGWRIYAVFDPNTSTLYPIIVYPKKAMDDANDDSINDAIESILRISQGTLFSED